MASKPILLFSGMGANEAVFRPQLAAFPNLIVPAWQRPLPNESLSDYCRRWADELRAFKPAILGGVSFGGIIAQEMARFLNPDLVLLIGSARSPRQIPRRIRVFSSLIPIFPLVPLSLLQTLAGVSRHEFFRKRFPYRMGILRQFAAADPAVLRWSARQILKWAEPPRVDCPVLHLHGERDPLFPLSYCQPDIVVPNAGHLPSITHPAAVNAFIQAALNRLDGLPEGEATQTAVCD